MSLFDDEKASPHFEKYTLRHLGRKSLRSTDDVAVDDYSYDDPNIDSGPAALEEESPYPEVRSAVANTDDPTMPCSTFRAWVIGLMWAILIPGVNQFFSFRYPNVTITQVVPLLLGFPLGKAWARYLPNVSIFGLQINPGPFTVKEHVITTIMASVAAPTAYSTEVIAVQRVFYNQKPDFAYQWLLVMSTQLIGFSIGGICKRFLVSPPSMIWPTNLVTSTLFNTLHSRETSGTKARGGISRGRFFIYVFFGYMLYNFLPSYLFTALSYFSWVCWIAPNNPTINQLFGVTHGMSMGLLTFDWGQIAYIGSPLATPWWAAANIGVTIVIFYWILVPILYFTNVWYTAYLPLVSSTSFDNRGHKFNVTKIINSDASFNLEAYQAYSPLFLSMSFAMAYGLSFASIASVISHTLLYYRKQIWTQARRSLSEQPDIHARLMSVYKEVPAWWYMSIFLSMFVFGIVAIEAWNTQFPVWAFVLALLIAFSYAVPIGMVQATTNQEVGLNVITEMIIGYVLPGRPIAMMLFKTWGYITMARALLFTSDFKLGHYMKIPPRQMFFCQVVATVVSGTVQLAVQSWMFSNIEDICTAGQKDGFICPGVTVFGTASIIWGVIGPQRLFSHGQTYYSLFFFFLIGAVMPFFQWILHKTFRFAFLKYVNFPLIFCGTAALPPATPLNFVPWVLLGITFNYVIRRRYFSWWYKYNFVLSAGLDAGYTVGVIIIFFALQYPKNNQIGANTIQTWWGNTVYTKTADARGVPHKAIPKGGTFGPSTW